MRRTLLVLSFLLTGVTCVLAQESKNEQLISAILNHNIDSVQLLLQQGANPNYENIYGVSPLLFAVEAGDTAVIRLLLDHGADINIVPPYDPPAVSFAVINFKDTIVHYLLDRGANPDIHDRAGRTPLYYAIRNGNYQAADLLLLYGADPDGKVEGWTPLQLAAYYNDTLLINMLVYYGADVNATDTLGYTPLHVAAQFNNLLAAKTLIKNKARLDLLTNDLASPVDIAVYLRSHDVFDFFMDNKPTFDNFVNGRFDTYQVAEFQQNYHARKVLKKAGIYSPTLVLDYYVRFTQFWNANDYMPGIDIGVKELFSNVSVSLGFYKRLFGRRIIIQQREHVFNQYWESRWVTDVMAKKDFYLFHTGRVNTYLSLGANFLMSYATYRGTLLTDFSKAIEPVGGVSFDCDRFGFELLVTYFYKPLLDAGEWYGNFGVFYRLPTIPVKIKTKKKIVY